MHIILFVIVWVAHYVIIVLDSSLSHITRMPRMIVNHYILRVDPTHYYSEVSQ